MRRFLTARALGLAVVALVLMAAMVALGFWQLGAYDEHQRDDARAASQRAPIPLDDALGADSGFPSGSLGRPVTAQGRYAATEQIYARHVPGADGLLAVVTPLVTDTGSAILVVRGTTPAGGDAQPPTGPVCVEGILQPSDAVGAALDSGRVTDGIRISSLVNDIDEDLYAGYIVLTSSSPGDALTPLSPPPADPSRWAGFRNLLYAVQWWVFAAFVAFMWWRIVTDADAPEHERVG